MLCHALLCGDLRADRAPTTLDARVGWADEALDLAARAGDLIGQFGAHHSIVLGTRRAGDFAAADAALERMAQLTDQLPLPNAEYLLMTDRSWRTLAAGRLDDAEQLIAAMRDRVERIGFPGGTIVAGAIELLCRYQGLVEEVVDFLNEVADTVLGGQPAEPEHCPRPSCTASSPTTR